MRRLGYDPKMLGQQRVQMLAYRIRRGSGRAEDGADGTRESVSDKNADCTKRTSGAETGGDNQKALEARVEYLEGQMDFLKRAFINGDGKAALGILTNEPASLFELIADTKAKGSRIPVREMCSMAGVSRSGYYGWLAAQPKREARARKDQEDFELILEMYTTLQVCNK